MKAKSDLLSTARQQAAPAKGKKPPRRVTVRMPTAERRAQVLAKAYEFFSEYGLTAQTLALAEACGVSQRLLYSLFLNKSELITAVYETEIAGPFKAVWFVQLTDRSTSMEQRLNAFYRDYYDTILTRRWLRLFLYSSLAEVDMAPTFIAQIVTHLMETIVKEAAHEAELVLPDSPAQCQEIGWILHGTVSHLAIRRHLYGGGSKLPVEQVLDLHVKSFLSGLPALLRASPERA